MTLQKKLDTIVSKTIRLEASDSMGFVKCRTCPNIKHWKYMQCGHYKRRGLLATRYDERNLGVQCEECNCFSDGENDKFAETIDEKYGPGTSQELETKSRQIIHDYPYEEEITLWQQRLKAIVVERNGIEY